MLAPGLLGLGALALGGCAAMEGAAVPGRTEVAAMAATYRYLFANNASGLQGEAAAYCVGAGAPADAADPSPALLAALADVAKVAPASSCRIGERVVDAAGRPSLFFGLKPLGCDGPGECLFEGGYYEADLSASNGRYRARNVDGRWQVAPEGPQAIS